MTAHILCQFEPALDPLIVERGSDRAVFLKLEVTVIRIAEAGADGLDQTAPGIDLGARVDAVLQQIEPRCLLLLAPARPHNGQEPHKGCHNDCRRSRGFRPG